MKPELAPLVLLFQEQAIDTPALLDVFAKLGLTVEVYADPRKFLLDIKNRRPAVAFVDTSTKPTKVPLAIIKTVHNVLGPTSMTVAIMTEGDTETMGQLKESGVTAVVEKPVALERLAKFLSRSIVTDGIAAVLSGKPVAVATAPASVAPTPTAAAPAAAAPAPTAPGPGAPLPETPEAVRFLFDKLVPVLARLNSALEWHDDVEVKFQIYTDKLTPHRDAIINLVRLLRKSEEKLDLPQSLRRFGLVNTRALTVAIALAESAPGVKFGFDSKTGLLTGDPVRVIPYASRTGDHFGDDTRYYHAAFAAGLVFDVLAAFATAETARKHALVKAIETSYADALRRVDKTLKAAKDVRNLSEDHHVTSTILMREAGKVVMALAHKDYLDRRATFEKKTVRASLQHLVEARVYGVSHNVVGGLLCLLAPALTTAYKAVVFYDYPFMIGRHAEDRHARDLALLCGKS